ncbi:hypothetical protein PZB74_08255 [Porifericola rhodea]|uniref:Kelch repeat-containing protein n=1 Tax=Porifericola rhodea TaxID=930972 RepID=UPI0026671C76|nr:hypothetical protein [Porifericola rhodea]WKN33326.1 hypothetical protein PZB74_08255 [Porifericola rhodea]
MKKYLFIFFVAALSFSCEEDSSESPQIDTSVSLTVPEVSSVGLYSAGVESSITFEDDDQLLTKGFGIAWSTSPDPVPHDSIQQTWENKTASVISQSPFPIADYSSDLQLNTTYYVRPYFVHANNTVVYGTQVSFNTLSGDGWHTLTNYPGELDQWPVGFAINNKIYVGLGLENSSSKSTVNNEWWEYDLNTNAWSQKTDFPGNVGIRATGFSIGNKGYVLSSNNEEEPAAFWEYDAQTDRWTRKADLPSIGRNNPAAFVLNKKAYVLGGLTAFDLHVWEFDPTATSEGTDEHGSPMGSWTKKDYYEGKSTNIFLPSVFVINDKAYIHNIYTTKDSNGAFVTQSELWSYNPETGIWLEKANFPGAIHQDMITFTINGKAYMGGNGISDFWKYEPSSNQWTPLNSANPAGHELSFSVGEKGYYFSEYNTIIEYVP